eukprot:353783-Chlamydomonas_euryale.AAC.6
MGSTGVGCPCGFPALGVGRTQSEWACRGFGQAPRPIHRAQFGQLPRSASSGQAWPNRAASSRLQNCSASQSVAQPGSYSPAKCCVSGRATWKVKTSEPSLSRALSMSRYHISITTWPCGRAYKVVQGAAQ